MKSYGLENVKAFADYTKVELAPITVFVGQNSCGKSSFIRFPVLLYQAIQDRAFPIRLHSERMDLVDYGLFDDVLHNHSGDSFSFSCSFDFQELSGIIDKITDVFHLNIFDGEVFETEGDLLEESLLANTENSMISTVSIKIQYSLVDEGICISSYALSFDGDLAAIMQKGTNIGEYRIELKKSLRKGKMVDVDYLIEVDTENTSLTPQIQKDEAYI